MHAEICEDVWVPIPPSGEAALAGATVLANLSASNITIGKAETRRLLCRSQSARCLAAYLYAAAGAGKSTTDLAWDGQASVFENGATLAETDRFPPDHAAAIADIDLDLLRQERLQMGSFDTNRRRHATHPFRTVTFRLDPPGGDVGFRRRVERFPFVPADRERLEQDCYEAYNIQVSGLTQRLRATGIKRVVIGVSGGLDSTQALIVCARAFDLLGLPRTGILAYTMPGFGTSELTRRNAVALMQSLGVTAAELDIRPAATRMLEDIHHPYADGKPVYDLTFENVQAGLRTDYLFRLANHHNGIVIGTGDLSELALGWCTYGVGDQMAHYNVNSGVPKTLIQHLIRWVIGSQQFAPEVLETLDAILATEISPELIPAAEGEAPQSTEAQIGPYALQDLPCSTPCVTASPRRRSPSWRCRPGRTPIAAIGRRISRRTGATRTTLDKSATGWSCSSAASSRSASSSAAPCRTGRRSAPAARYPPEATGALRPTATPTPGWRSWTATCRRTRRDPWRLTSSRCRSRTSRSTPPPISWPRRPTRRPRPGWTARRTGPTTAWRCGASQAAARPICCICGPARAARRC